jgi:hypothetical protein
VQAALYGPVGGAAGLVRVTALLQRLLHARAPGAGSGHQHQPIASRR